MRLRSRVESSMRDAAPVAAPRTQCFKLRREKAMPQWKKWATSIALAASAGWWLSPATGAEEPVKVGFVYVSPIGDAGWTFQHDSGRKEMEKALAGKVTTKFVESVPEGADAERVIRELAQSGNKIIFTTSFGYMNPTLKVAKQFPHTH